MITPSSCEWFYLLLFTGCSLSWTVEIPSYFNNSSPCMEVVVKGSDLGSGVQIIETRTQFWTENIDNSIDVDLTIVTENGKRAWWSQRWLITIVFLGDEVVDVAVFDGASVVIVRNTANGTFQLYHGFNSGISLDNDQEEWMINTLPGCVNYQEGQG